MGVSCSLTAYEVSNSMNIEKNTTNIYVKLTATTTSSSHNFNNPSGWIKVNGVKYTYNKDLPYTDTVTLWSKTLTITHNTDGSKTVPISYSFATGISAGTLTGSKNLILTTIPRASTNLSVSEFNIEEGFSGTITKNSNTFTDKLIISYETIPIKTIDNFTSNTVYSFTDSETLSLYKQSGTNLSLSLSFNIETYNGTTLLGNTSSTAIGNIKGNMYAKNGSNGLTRCVAWINDNGVWKKALGFKNSNGSWKKGI